jgi:hypothetical protein
MVSPSKQSEITLILKEFAVVSATVAAPVGRYRRPLRIAAVAAAFLLMAALVVGCKKSPAPNPGDPSTSATTSNGPAQLRGSVE